MFLTNSAGFTFIYPCGPLAHSPLGVFYSLLFNSAGTWFGIQKRWILWESFESWGDLRLSICIVFLVQHRYLFFCVVFVVRGEDLSSFSCTFSLSNIYLVSDQKKRVNNVICMTLTLWLVDACDDFNTLTVLLAVFIADTNSRDAKVSVPVSTWCFQHMFGALW